MTTSTDESSATPKGLSSLTSPPPSATAPPPSASASSPPLPVAQALSATAPVPSDARDRKRRREAPSRSSGVISSGDVLMGTRSEEHTSELQSRFDLV